MTYRSETWSMTRKEQNMLSVFERNVLGCTQGPINEMGIRRRRYKREIYQDFNDIEIVRHVKIGHRRRAGHVQIMMGERMPEIKQCQTKEKTRKQVDRRNRRRHKDTGVEELETSSGE